jgi:ketosteroid isomerase-like protein
MELKPAGTAIAEHRALFRDALSRGDAELASTTYAPDAQLLAPSTKPIVGRADIRAFWQAGIDAGVIDVDLRTGGTTHNDGLAYETGEYEFKVAASGAGRVVERGFYVQVYQRQDDGSWQRAVEIFSPGGGE